MTATPTAAGIANWYRERCESGQPECGPVYNHDSEGVPLCKVCWDGLLADAVVK